MDEGGLEVAEPWRHIPGHPEVGVLVDGARDEARHALVIPEYRREGAAKGGRCLDCREGNFTD